MSGSNGGGAALRGVALLAAALVATGATGASAQEATEERLESVENQLRAVRDELQELKRAEAVDQARVAEVEGEMEQLRDVLGRVKLGGYGSVRFEGNDLDAEETTFTFRRLVFTTDARIGPRLRFYSELEYERFRKLELERSAAPIGVGDGGPGLEVEQEVEGTNQSEIALEQAWLEFEIDPRLRLRAGGLLVPLGRFNLNHDDNQWNLPRRTLVDRGVPVLPSKSAWDELGVGFTGDFDLGEGGLDYHLYVVNGVTIEPEVEEIIKTRAAKRDVLELEAEFSPQTGTFGNDTKEGKAVTGRLAWQPVFGHELAASFYTGRYTPEFLADRDITAFAVDGITRFAGFELEGTFATTHFGGSKQVAESFAERARRRASANDSAFDPTLEGEIEFELEGIAKRVSGYWLELRRPFWPAFLPQGPFDRPQLIPTARFEQVWWNDRLTSLDFENGAVTELETDDSSLNRATVGLAYRPTPLVVFTAAYEYMWTDEDSLSGLTNFLSAGPDEDDAHALLMGASFGF